MAHCPGPCSSAAESPSSPVGGYLRRGLNIGIGTDTFPHNMLEEMRAVGIGSRMVSQDVWDLRLSQIFDCATLGGARALGRDDIGRIAVGAKADIVMVDLNHPMMRPVRDPLRSLVYAAAERAVKTVYVDGAKVVEGGRVLTLDYEAAHRRPPGGAISRRGRGGQSRLGGALQLRDLPLYLSGAGERVPAPPSTITKLVRKPS